MDKGNPIQIGYWSQYSHGALKYAPIFHKDLPSGLYLWTYASGISEYWTALLLPFQDYRSLWMVKRREDRTNPESSIISYPFFENMGDLYPTILGNGENGMSPQSWSSLFSSNAQDALDEAELLWSSRSHPVQIFSLELMD